MKNIVYLGSDVIGLATLQWLANGSNGNFRLMGVVSGQDQRCGRGMKLVPNEIVAWTRAQGIPLLQPQYPKKEILPWMSDLHSDMGVVFAYGHILTQELLDAIPMGFLNLHASLLPELRGPCPIEAAIAQRKSQTGITLMQLVKEMDAGPTYVHGIIPMDEMETAPSLRKKMEKVAVMLMDRHFESILSNEEKAVKQDHSRATYVKLLKKSDGLLDFQKPAHELEAQVRAYITWPGSYFYKGDLAIKVGSAHWREWEADDPRTPGFVMGIRNHALEIATGDGVFCCKELQFPTKKMLAASMLAHHFPSAHGNI
ncbi:MAG: methionyl-tRNA formyltransferase [Puniceicoccales bacterium]|nr:methionyl-tRNA formyltransferase [Puniceicoccales bacterium]